MTPYLDAPDSETPGLDRSDPPRWPRVVGTIGIVVAVIMFVDKFDDLLMLPWLQSREWWVGLVGEGLATDILRWMPPSSWIAFASVIGMALGALLFVGALKIRRRHRSGVALCRIWAWLAIVWLLVELSLSLWWVSGLIGELAPPGEVLGPALFTIVVILAVILAFPVFLLSWFNRPVIKAQLAAWPA